MVLAAKTSQNKRSAYGSYFNDLSFKSSVQRHQKFIKQIPQIALSKQFLKPKQGKSYQLSQ